MENTYTWQPRQLKMESLIEGVRPFTDLLFTFYIKAEACFVAGSQKLNRRSLDRYQGPAQSIELGGLTIALEEGFKEMEVIPLAGDESYWGADFLITLTLLNKTLRYTISRS